MRTTVSFFHLLEEAVWLIFRSKPLLWLGLPFGILGFLSLQLSEHLTPLLQDNFSSPENFFAFFLEHQTTFMVLISALLCIGILRVLLRGPLFLFIERALLNTLPDSPKEIHPHQKPLLRAAGLSFLFETLYWAALTLLGLIIFSPILIASKVNPMVIPSLFQMGTIFLLVIALTFFYMKEFGLLYSLLTGIKPRLALELGLKLFQKHLLFSLLFGLFLIALSLLFTFFLNLAIITSALIPFFWLEVTINALGGIIVFGLATLITETLHLLFFHALAVTPHIKIVETTKKIIEGEKSTSGASTI